MSCRKYLSPVILVMVCASLFGQQADKPAATKSKSPENLHERILEKQREALAAQMLINQVIQTAWNTDMHEELALVPEQVEKLKNIAKEHQKIMIEKAVRLQEDANKIQELVKAGDHEGARVLGEEIQTGMIESTGKLTEQIQEILLPHQIDRLKQIVKQQTMKHTNQFRDEFGIAFGLAKEIGMTDEETEKLKKTIEDVRKQYYADVEKLKEKANKKILAAIPLEKREKLKELTGEFYDREKGTRRTFSALQEANKKKAQGDSENDKDDEREN